MKQIIREELETQERISFSLPRRGDDADDDYSTSNLHVQSRHNQPQRIFNRKVIIAYFVTVLITCQHNAKISPIFERKYRF